MDRRTLRRCAAVVLGLSATAMALTFTWIGDAGSWTDWEDNNNWATGVPDIPGYPDGPLDDAIIRGHVDSYLITLDSDETIGSLTLSPDTDGQGYDETIFGVAPGTTQTLTTSAIFIDGTTDQITVTCKNGAILKNN